MGLFDFFRGRRERESALPDGAQMSIGEPAQAQSAGPGQADASALGDLGQLGGLGELIKQAASQGHLQVNQEPAQVMNLQGQGDELRNAILQTLREHGIEAHKGDQIQVTDAAVQQAIFKTLSQHGLDVSQMEGGADLGAALGASSALTSGGDSIGQLERLQKLREEGALTEAEFQDQKKRLLGE